MESNEYAEAGFYTKKEKSAGTLFFHFLFSHFGLFIVVSLYAVAGAYVFVDIENAHEERQYKMKQDRAVQVEQAMNYLSHLFWYQQDNKTDYKDYNESMYANLKKLEDFVILSVSKYKYDGTVNGWDYRWTFTKSLLFTMTIMSTIGYGHIFPVTSWGKFFCIIYSIIGCPLLLIFLGNLGNSMANVLIYIYSRCCCRPCRGRRNLEELPSNTSKKYRKLLIDDVVGKEDYMPTDEVNVPITINLVMLFLYIMLGAVLFSFWEGWDLGSSCYFTFVTLSTIGYGDMVPGNAILNGSDDGSATFKMLICILYILLGMVLLSMCINLMQEQLVNKCRWLAREIGLGGSTSEPIEDPKDNENQEVKKKKKKRKRNKNCNNGEQGPVAGVLPQDDGDVASYLPSATGTRTSSASSTNSASDSRAASALSLSPSTRSSDLASESPSPATRPPSPATRPPSAVSRSPSPAPRSPSPAPRSPSPAPRSPSPAPMSPSPAPRSPSPAPRSPSPAPRSPSPAPRSPSPAPRSPSPAPRSPSPAPRSPSPTPRSPSPPPRSPSPAPRSPSPAFRSPSPVPRALSAGSNSLAPISMSPEPARNFDSPSPGTRSPSPSASRSPSVASRISSASSCSSSSSLASLPQSSRWDRPGILHDF
ncbi:uncharacterized protein [Panulirus ornatus]|uniref:uncharacterized protein n=1 Tax=Panulirus ornatus TaxID=150431 RepID=UPI003A839F5A